MSNYRTVQTKLYSDKNFLGSTKDCRWLFVYLISNKHINNSGVYELPLSTIHHETAIEKATIKKLFASGLPKNVFYDFENEMVFVKNSRVYFPGGNPVKVEKGILNEFTQTSKTPLWSLFLDAYPCFKEIFLTVSKPLPKGSLPLPTPIVNNNNKKKEFEKEILEVLDYLNQEADKDHFPTESNCAIIRARFKERYSVEDCKIVIDNKVAQWKGDAKMDEFLRPSTLFQKKKFDGYRNAKPQKNEVKTVGAAKRRQLESLMAREQPVNLIENGA